LRNSLLQPIFGEKRWGIKSSERFNSAQIDELRRFQRAIRAIEIRQTLRIVTESSA